MRKAWLVMALALAAFAAAGIAVKAQTYGPGYMMGPGYGPGPGYGHGYMMGPGYGGYGPGYMMGPGYRYDRDYRRGRGYRGQRMCWHEADSDRSYGYYELCR